MPRRSSCNAPNVSTKDRKHREPQPAEGAAEREQLAAEAADLSLRLLRLARELREPEQRQAVAAPLALYE